MNLHTGIGGEFNLVITKADGTKSETGWFKNLILDQGLDEIGIANNGTNIYVLGFCQIGTGTTAPATSQVSLTAWSAGTPRAGSASVVNAGSPTYASAHTITYPFPQGAVVGNMAEIGTGWATSGSTLFSRALILDNAGNPTTITVTSVDQLTIYYKITFTPDTSIVNGSVTLAGTVYNYTSSLAYAGSVYSNGDILLYQDFYSGYNASYCFFTAPASTIALGPKDSIFSGAQGWYYGNGGPSSGIAPYTLGSYYRDTTYAFSVNSANEAGGIGAVAPVLGSGGGNPSVQYVFTPPIPKDNTKTFSLTFRTSWGRGA